MYLPVVSLSETPSEACQISKIEHFEELVNVFQSLTLKLYRRCLIGFWICFWIYDSLHIDDFYVSPYQSLDLTLYACIFIYIYIYKYIYMNIYVVTSWRPSNAPHSPHHHNGFGARCQLWMVSGVLINIYIHSRHIWKHVLLFTLFFIFLTGHVLNFTE